MFELYGIYIKNVKFICIKYFRNKEVGGGSILDLGVYTVHFVDTIFGPSKPNSIVSEGILNSHGTDQNISAILKYPKGKIAVITTHTKVKMDCSAYVYGTNGTIKVILKYYFKLTMMCNPQH